MSRTKQSVQRELKQLYINLNRLQEKITAEGGEIGASLRWLNQRDETQTSIAELEELLHTGELPDETTPGGETTGLGKLVNVPELPPHFLPRPDDLTSVKAALLGGEQPVAITAPTRKVGVQGMGGVGKSVLAAALARDAEVRRAFPDGVFWLTLGQEPALTTRQAQLAESLGDPIRIFGDAQQGRARLSEVLAERTGLLILDDVWQVAHAEAFNVLGPAGRLLLTSRDAGVIRALGVAEYRLDVLGKPQALDLLAQWAGQPLETFPPEAPAVVKECGYLPLALAMVGAQLKGKPDRWANVLHKLRQADLAKIRQQFPHYPYPDLLRALHVSVEALEPEVKARYLELAVFPEDTPIPEAALQTFWASEGLDEYDVQDMLDILVDRSLARRDEQGRLSLHDLQYDYVRKQAGDLTPLHRRLMDAYRQKCPNGWASGPDDSYFFEHLAYHLAEAGRCEELYGLINKEWMDMQLQRTSSHLAFAQDVEWAIEVARKEEPPNWVQLTRTCLIFATFISLSYFVPPAALGVLTLLGHIERAKGYAVLMESGEHQSRAYLSIGQALLVRGEREEAIVMLRQALEAVAVIDLEMFKVEALDDVVQIIAQAKDKSGLNRALEIVKAMQYEEYRLKGLCSVTLALIEMQELDEALNVIETIEDERIKDILAKLAQPKTVDVVNKEENVGAKDIESRDKSFTLDNLALSLTYMRQLDQALAVVNTIRDEQTKVHTLGKMAHILARIRDKIGLSRVRTVIEAIKNERDRASGLVSLAQSLVMIKEFEQAVIVAESIENRFWKLSALSEVAMALAQVGERTKATELTNRVLTSTEAIGLEVDKASVLSKIAQALVKVKKLEYSLAVTEAIDDKATRVTAMVKVAQILIQMKGKHGAAGVANQALLIAEAIGDDWGKVDKLSEVTQVLILIGNENKAIKAIENALTIAEAIKDKSTEVVALNKLAEVLAQLDKKDKATEVINWALTTAEEIERNWERSRQLNSIAQTLTRMMERNRALKVVHQALAAAEAIKDELGKAYPLMETAQNLAQLGEFDQALTVAETIQKEDDKAFALSSVVHALVQVRKFDQALTIAERIEFTYERTRALTKIAHSLAQEEDRKRAIEVINQALIAAKTAKERYHKVSALTEVAQVMVEIEGNKKAIDVLNQAMVVANAIKHNRHYR